ncbi:glycosyltransferase, partial [Prochlorococcus sp. AH-736-J10]|nr:glycosyltransferase [Prochlorococcus sp. AH-736-J10]
MKKNLKSRTIFIIANSSWYLNHYRKYLLNELKIKNFYNVVTISPLDDQTKELSKLSLNIPWRISRSGNKNLLKITKSLIRLILIFRSLKPIIVHSHTLKTNFLTSIAAFFFSTPCIISFAGLGQIATSKGLKRIIFIFLIKIIGFFSSRQLTNNKILKRDKRTSFIFQNKNDMNFVSNIIKIPDTHKHLIFGSGVPDYFLTKIKTNNWIKKSSNLSNKNNLKINLIYLSRLLKSKGILTFVEIANNFKKSNSSVYGSIDPSSSDSLTQEDIRNIIKNNKNLKFYGFKKEPLLEQNYNYPILLVPSNYGEGLPRGIVEALALKIPVISSKKATCDLFDESLIYIA